MSLRFIATTMKNQSLIEKQPKTKEVGMLAILLAKPNIREAGYEAKKNSSELIDIYKRQNCLCLSIDRQNKRLKSTKK